MALYDIFISYSSRNRQPAYAMCHEDTPMQTQPVESARSSKPASAPVTKTYKVGDYYNENGKEGVVFEVDETGCHGKIVGMKQVELQWCNEEYEKRKAAGATDKTDGMKNMQTIMRIPDWRSKYPAFAWCAEQGEGWYLPAIEELKRFTSNDSIDDSIYDVVNRTLSQHNGDLLCLRSYWSSSEDEDKEYEFCTLGVFVYNGITGSYGMAYGTCVRAVSAF